MNLTMAEFVELCQIGEKLMREPQKRGLSGFALLYALGGIESAFGRIPVPRFEAAYSVNAGGRYRNAALHKLFGDAAAASYGPWQIMFPNARRMVPTITPQAMMTSPMECLLATVLFLDHEINLKKCVSVESVLDTWNTGRPDDSIKPAPPYMVNGLAYYQKAVDGTAVVEAKLGANLGRPNL